MRVSQYEWKKILYHQRVMYLILLFQVASFVGLFLFDSPVNAAIEENRESYTYYLSQAQGKISLETERFFEEQSKEFADGESQIQRIYQKVSDGEWTEEEYLVKLRELEEKMQGKQGFLVLYDQYMYAREDTDLRYLLNTNSWDALLSNDTLDFLLLLFVMIVSVLCFGTEITSEMDVLIRISSGGEKKAGAYKLLLVIILSVCNCMLAYAVKWMFLEQKYGFAHGDYPIQSLSYFSSYSGEVSLSQAAWGVFWWKILGCVVWTVMMSAFMVWLRKYAITMLFGISLILIPYVGIPNAYVKYFLPGPIGAVIGSGYFRGSSVSIDSVSGKEVYEFVQVSSGMKCAVIVMDGLLILLFSIYVISKYSNVWSRRLFKKMKVVTLGSLLCMMSCTGCSQGKESVDSIYTMNSRYHYENDQYIVYLDYSNAEQIDIKVRDKDTGDTESLIRDVFVSGKEIVSGFCGKGDYIYYIELTYDKKKEEILSGEYDKISLVSVNLNDFSSRIVFQDSAKNEISDVFGLMEVANSNMDLYLGGLVCFVVDDNKLFVVAQDSMYELDLRTKKKKLLFHFAGEDKFSYEQGVFYYLDDLSRLRKYDVETGESVLFADIVASNFILTETDIIYTNRLQNGNLTCVNRNSGERTVLYEKNQITFASDGMNVFLIDKDRQIMEWDDAKEEWKKIGETSDYYVIYAFRGYDKILIPDMAEGKMMEYEK